MKYHLLLLTCLLFSCTKEVLVSREDVIEREKKDTVEYYYRYKVLPSDVKYIETMDNGWVIIEIKNNRFLYRGMWLGSNGTTEVMVPYVEK